jgi:mannose-6-phosphate isomerase class I
MVEAGTVHALKAGTLVYEIQTSSDTTYRLYDYDREKTTPGRKLHIQECLDNINIPSTHQEVINNDYKLIDNKYFSFYKIENKIETNYQ